MIQSEFLAYIKDIRESMQAIEQEMADIPEEVDEQRGKPLYWIRKHLGEIDDNLDDLERGVDLDG